MIKQWKAKRDLAKHVALNKALNSDFTARRDRALTPQRKAHIASLLAGFVRERAS